MTTSCRLFATEYNRSFVKHKLNPAKKIVPTDEFAERVEEGQIDPRVASIPAKLDHDAEELIYKRILDNQRTVYQITFKNPWLPRHVKQADKEGTEVEKTEVEEKDLGSELLAYINEVYFNPHEEDILAPSATTKRILGYIRPKLLHANLSMYQDTIGRSGATVIIKEHDKKKLKPSENTKTSDNVEPKSDPCNTENDKN